jgi:hypothetical protein
MTPESFAALDLFAILQNYITVNMLSTPDYDDVLPEFFVCSLVPCQEVTCAASTGRGGDEDAELSTTVRRLLQRDRWL